MRKRFFHQMVPNKKINVFMQSLYSDEAYALLDKINSDIEEDIDHLMKYFDTEFVDRVAVEM